MSENMYQRWFVVDYYAPAGRPQMEDQLMAYAKKQWLHCSVYQTFIEGMVKDLKERQESLWNANKRLKKVDIHASSLQPTSASSGSTSASSTHPPEDSGGNRIREITTTH